MTEHDPIDPLPSELAALFESERSRPDPNGAVYVRVLDRVASSVGTSGPDGDGGSGSGTTGGGGATAAASKVSARASLIALAFLAGAGAGASLHALLAAPPVAAPAATSPMLVPSASTSAAREESVPGIAVDDLPTASAVSQPSAKPAPVTAASSRHDEVRAKDTGLAAERALLEEARMALAQGSAPAAIAALQRHESEFPRGRLAEEREAMLVQALVRAAQRGEAESRARAFRDRYPGSLLAPIVEGAVRNPQAP